MKRTSRNMFKKRKLHLVKTGNQQKNHRRRIPEKEKNNTHKDKRNRKKKNYETEKYIKDTEDYEIGER